MHLMQRGSLARSPLLLVLLFQGWAGEACPTDMPGSASPVELPDGFDPAKWPGVLPKDAARQVAALNKQLASTQNRKDSGAIKAIVAELRKGLGPYAGCPEVKPEYGAPIESGPADLARAEALCRTVLERTRGRTGWEVSARARAAGGVQQRLRVSFRTAMSDLRCFEAGVAPAAEFRTTALAGFDYIVSQQTSVGVFGYPYNPKATSGVQAGMLRIVRDGESRGIRMTEGDWCIEDLTDGGLQFDNGESGAGLLYAYAVTGERKYLDAARRAGDWAAARQLVPNWNYNSFSGCLLARLYRATGEHRYLDAAKDKFEFGVLPGQMENGRWVDPHNAKPQYHALMARNLVEYWLALRQANDPLVDSTRRHAESALDSLAEETTRYGASNTDEGLPLEALCIGLIALGPNAHWERAAHVYANYLVNHLLPDRLESGRSPVPESLPAYILWRKVRDGLAKSRD